MEHKGTVRLETQRLILRRFTLEDLEPAFMNCWRHADVWKWTNYAPMNSIGEVVSKAGMFTEKWLAAYDRADRYSWAIELKNSGSVIGRISGLKWNERLREVEMCYELGPDWWNQGLMTEAAQEIIRFFLLEVGFNRVYAYHAAGNPASGRVMQKCGMLQEGTARQGCVCNGGVFDRVDYAILREDIL